MRWRDFQMGELRLREVSWPAQCHITRKCHWKLSASRALSATWNGLRPSPDSFLPCSHFIRLIWWWLYYWWGELHPTWSLISQWATGRNRWSFPSYTPHTGAPGSPRSLSPRPRDTKSDTFALCSLASGLSQVLFLENLEGCMEEGAQSWGLDE